MGGILGGYLTTALLPHWDLSYEAFLSTTGHPLLAFLLVTELLFAVEIVVAGTLFGSLYGLACLAGLLGEPLVEILAALLSQSTR